MAYGYTLKADKYLHKKLCYRRRTARRAMSVKILSTAAQRCPYAAYGPAEATASQNLVVPFFI